MQRFRVLTLSLGLSVLLGTGGCATASEKKPESSGPVMAGAKALGLVSSPKTHEVTFTALESEIVIDGNGTKYKAWTFNGQMPGPVVRVTEGDTVNFTLIGHKDNSFPHSMDFHAAELDFLANYHRTVGPGETHKYSFVAKKPGVFFYHCRASPMIQHVARGMFGAIIVDPKDANAWPKADREFVLVQSEFWKNPTTCRRCLIGGGTIRFSTAVSSSTIRSSQGESRWKSRSVNGCESIS